MQNSTIAESIQRFRETKPLPRKERKLLSNDEFWWVDEQKQDTRQSEKPVVPPKSMVLDSEELQDFPQIDGWLNKFKRKYAPDLLDDDTVEQSRGISVAWQEMQKFDVDRSERPNAVLKAVLGIGASGGLDIRNDIKRCELLVKKLVAKDENDIWSDGVVENPMRQDYTSNAVSRSNTLLQSNDAIGDMSKDGRTNVDPILPECKVRSIPFVARNHENEFSRPCSCKMKKNKTLTVKEIPSYKTYDVGDSRQSKFVDLDDRCNLSVRPGVSASTKLDSCNELLHNNSKEKVYAEAGLEQNHTVLQDMMRKIVTKWASSGLPLQTRYAPAPLKLKTTNHAICSKFGDGDNLLALLRGRIDIYTKALNIKKGMAM